MKIEHFFWKTTRAILASILLSVLLITPGRSQDSYRIQRGDKLKIDVWQEENLRADVLVLPDGMINFPLVGVLPAAGKTTSELAALLKEKLADFIPGPEVQVSVITLEGNLIYVLGEVARPGPFILTKNLTIVQALSMAGGLTPYAEKNDIHVVRQTDKGKTVSLPFRYGDVEDGKNLDSIILLQSGDTIIVP